MRTWSTLAAVALSSSCTSSTMPRGRSTSTAGRWEGDTLVVDTLGFNGKGPLDIFGNPRSERMRITERYRRRDVGHLDIEITFDDPVVYTKAFTIKVTHLLPADTDILDTSATRTKRIRFT